VDNGLRGLAYLFADGFVDNSLVGWANALSDKTTRLSNNGISNNGATLTIAKHGEAVQALVGKHDKAVQVAGYAHAVTSIEVKHERVGSTALLSTLRN
jgi:hypothetical protein